MDKTEKSSSHKLVSNSTFVIIMLIIFFPLGLFLLWKYSRFSKSAKSWITVFTIIIAVILYTISPHHSSDNSASKNPTTSPKASSTPKLSASPKVVSKSAPDQSAAENFCEDAELLGQYVDLKNIDIVTLNYNPIYLTDLGYVNDSGNAVATFQWVGKDKETNTNVGFVCWVSNGTKGIELNELSVSGKIVYGPNGASNLTK